MTPAMEIWQKECPDDYNAMVATCPLGRVGDAEQDIARAVLAITSPNLRYMTGSTFMLDGGQQRG